MDNNNTRNTNFFKNEREEECREVLSKVIEALREKTSNPSLQLVGYLFIGDPMYITSYNNARDYITKVDRINLLTYVISEFLKSGTSEIINDKVKETLDLVIAALNARGYDTAVQLAGYIATNEPVYITAYNGARTIITCVERDVLLGHIVSIFLKNYKNE